MSQFFTVTEKAMRPASGERQCFYCRTAVGGFHKPDCVLIRRKVTITVELEVDVPVDWDEDNIEHYYTDANGYLDLARYFTRDGNTWDVTAGAGFGEPFLDEH